jgi:hypothetical protein
MWLRDQKRKDPPVKGKRPYSARPSMATSSVGSSLAVRANLYAQEMNNSAVSCIEIGHYSRAITSLTRALELHKRQQRSKDVAPCNCYQCTLDGCIVQAAEKCRPPSKHAKVVRTKGYCKGNPSGGYISRRPIKVNSRGHAMGPALYVIIVYNLGLAKHIIAIGSSDNSERKKIIQGAIATYNLAHEMQASLLLQHENSKDPWSTEAVASLRSIRFEMMVLNNMSQLHKLNLGTTEHDHCLRRLLSIIMMVVDQQVRALSTEGRIAPLWRIELDGFLRNTVSLMLQPGFSAVSA